MISTIKNISAKYNAPSTGGTPPRISHRRYNPIAARAVVPVRTNRITGITYQSPPSKQCDAPRWGKVQISGCSTLLLTYDWLVLSFHRRLILEFLPYSCMTSDLVAFATIMMPFLIVG